MKLAELRITSPCPESWEAMTGDDRARVCARCQLAVVDLAELRRADAERLIAEREPDRRLCVRAHHDREGNVATREAAHESFLSALQVIASWRGGGGA